MRATADEPAPTAISADDERQRPLLDTNDFNGCRKMRFRLVDVAGREPPLPEFDRLR